MNKPLIVNYQDQNYAISIEDFFIFQANGKLKEQILRKYTVTKVLGATD